MIKTRLTDIQLAYLVGRSTSLYLGGNSTHGYVEFQGSAEPEGIEKAVNQLIRRHPMLRTVINEDGTQEVLDSPPAFKVSFEDISQLSETAQNKKIEDYREKYSGRIFECGKFPMFAIHAFRLGDEIVRYCFDSDLMIMDRSSFEIFFNELELIYNGMEDSLPELKNDFFTYVNLREEMKLKNAQADEEFFTEFAENFPVSAGIPECRSPKFSNMPFTYTEGCINGEKWQSIKDELARRHIIPTVYLMVCYAKTLAKWSGEQRAAVNVTSALRTIGGRAFSGVIGDFTELVIAVADFSGGKDIYTVCKQVRKDLRRSMSHYAGGGIRLLRRISELHGIENGAPCPYAFTSSIDENGSKLKENILGRTVYQISQTPQVRLDCQVYEDSEKLYIRFDYPLGVNDGAAVAQMHEFMLEYAENGFADYPAKLQREYNQTDWETENVTIQQLFARQAAAHPDRTAVLCNGERFT